jgi:hypothetical protein
MSGVAHSCSFCGSRDVEIVSDWGVQLITSQLKCNACNSYFEAIRDDFSSQAACKLDANDVH